MVRAKRSERENKMFQLSDGIHYGRDTACNKFVFLIYDLIQFQRYLGNLKCIKYLSTQDFGIILNIKIIVIKFENISVDCLYLRYLVCSEIDFAFCHKPIFFFFPQSLFIKQRAQIHLKNRKIKYISVENYLVDLGIAAAATNQRY